MGSEKYPYPQDLKGPELVDKFSELSIDLDRTIQGRGGDMKFLYMLKRQYARELLRRLEERMHEDTGRSTKGVPRAVRRAEGKG